MILKQRISRSEIHFYIKKLQNRGYKKVSSQTTKNSMMINFRKEVEDKVENLTLKFTNNGWLTIY